MSDVSIFNIGGTEIHVKDATARTTANSANTTATQAMEAASQANDAVAELEKLSRVTVVYSQPSETITITTGTHALE